MASSSSLTAAMMAAHIICDVCRFGVPVSHCLFSSGCDVAFLPRSSGVQTDVAGDSQIFGFALRKIDWSVTAFAGLAVADEAVADGACGGFVPIKLQI
jgi:hypothetical protein